MAEKFVSETLEAHIGGHTTDATMAEEDPLHSFRVVVSFGGWVERELVLLVVVLREVQKNGTGLEYLEVTTIRVHDGRTSKQAISFNVSSNHQEGHTCAHWGLWR